MRGPVPEAAGALGRCRRAGAWGRGCLQALGRPHSVLRFQMLSTSPLGQDPSSSSCGSKSRRHSSSLFHSLSALSISFAFGSVPRGAGWARIFRWLQLLWHRVCDGRFPRLAGVQIADDVSLVRISPQRKIIELRLLRTVPTNCFPHQGFLYPDDFMGPGTTVQAHGSTLPFDPGLHFSRENFRGLGFWRD